MRIQNLLKSLDANPYTIQLNYKNKQEYKSKTGGCITLLFYLISLGIIGWNLYLMFVQEELVYSQEEIKNDLGPIQIDRRDIGLLIIGWDGDGREVNVTVENQDFYGLKVYVNHSTNPHQTVAPTIQAVACEPTQSFNWTPDFFCFPKQFNTTISGRSDVIMRQSNAQPYNKLTIIIKNTTSPISPISSISPISPPPNQLFNIQVKLLYINNVISPKSEHPIVDHKVRVFYINDGVVLNYRELQQLTLFFKKLYVTTDFDRYFFGTKSEFNDTFYDQESQTSIITDSNPAKLAADPTNNWLVQIKLKRSLYTVKYDRQYKKLASYLAQSLGIIGLVSLIFILYKGYNKWHFTQQQLLPKQHQQGTNIFKYYWSLLRELKVRLMTEHSTIQADFQHKMDIYKILEKLEKFEDRLRVLEGKSNIEYGSGHQPQHVTFKNQSSNGKSKKMDSSSSKKDSNRKSTNKNKVQQPLLTQQQIPVSQYQSYNQIKPQ